LTESDPRLIAKHRQALQRGGNFTMPKSPRPNATRQGPSILWSAAFVVSLLLAVAGAVLIVMDAASLGPTHIELSPKGGLKVQTQSGGPLLLAIGAGLLVCLAALLPKSVRVFDGGTGSPLPVENRLSIWIRWLRGLAYIGLAIAAFLLLRLYL
jgi:hypothetical protein